MSAGVKQEKKRKTRKLTEVKVVQRVASSCQVIVACAHRARIEKMADNVNKPPTLNINNNKIIKFIDFKDIKVQLKLNLNNQGIKSATKMD